MNARSSAAAATAPANSPRLRPGSAAPQLRVIEGTIRTGPPSILPIIIAAALLFLAAIVVPLVVNTNMASMAYDIRDQRILLDEENARLETLGANLLEAQSTPPLREKAAEIGMVPAGPIGIISVEKGTVEGGVPAK